MQAIKRVRSAAPVTGGSLQSQIMAVPMGGGVSEIVEVPYVEHYPPDTAAIRYYLNNRAPSEWWEWSETGAPGGEIVVRVVGGLPNDESDAIRDGDHEMG